jgi:RNA polymerase sigma factor (sigma-70 family)
MLSCHSSGAQSDRWGIQSDAGLSASQLDSASDLQSAGNDKALVLPNCARMTDPAASAIAGRRFREIVPPLLDDAYTLAKWLCRNGADAEDIVQEAAIRALKALETTAVDRPKPWFLMIVRNAAMTWIGRNRPQRLAFVGDMSDLDAIDPRLGEEAPDPEEALIALEDGERLRNAIADLPPPLLETLVMREVNGLSYRDIAEATAAPIGTVMSRLARARAALARTLKADR